MKDSTQILAAALQALLNIPVALQTRVAGGIEISCSFQPLPKERKLLIRHTCYSFTMQMSKICFTKNECILSNVLFHPNGFDFIQGWLLSLNIKVVDTITTLSLIPK